MKAEQQRLLQARGAQVPWRKWGPYLSERQWGTVREDYSDDGNAWDYFSHDQARSRAYRWGEDGLAGISDDRGLLCFALALWNGNDPIIKERLFGLTNSEGNHGEDVKEYYYYLDSTPTHSYMKYLYKYPHAAYPYDDIVNTNRTRSRSEREYELIDTGVFADDAYFDVFVEYAKAGPEDIAIKISVHNRGRTRQSLQVLPTLWFRNTWWDGSARPELHTGETPAHRVIHAHPSSDLPLESSPGDYRLWCEGTPDLLFTDNDTNQERIFGQPNPSPYVKDAFDQYIVHGQLERVNPALTGTKAAAHYTLEVGPGEVGVVRLRLQRVATRGPLERRASEIVRQASDPFEGFEALLQARLQDADDFYRAVTPASLTSDEARVMRQGLAGMLWSKQHYTFDADEWLKEHGAHPLDYAARATRNSDWFHMQNSDVISMPDKWEYPWYAAWDLAFHTLALSIVDPDFAREQLALMLSGRYIHPNGQVPAYEWNFSDVNPPVHAWATLFLYRMQRSGEEVNLDFLKSAFVKLSLNFTWWVNRKDRNGKNLFEGGFLGLDNIGVFDRSSPLPTGGHLEQADGTAWMAFFSQCMADFAVELAGHDRTYEDMAAKYLEHFLWIAAAMNAPGKEGMWDEADGFYYDILRLPDGSATRLKVRSMVGLLPLCATRIIEPWQREQVPHVVEYMTARVRRMPELFASIHPTGARHRGVNDRGIMALVNPERLRRILTRMLDEGEFLSAYGIRSLSRAHREHPYVFHAGGRSYSVAYEPGESCSGMFGGNSNWRGPIWMPVNVLLISALLNYYLYYGDTFEIECPTGSGQLMNLFEVAREISRRLSSIFVRDAQGRRAVFGDVQRFQEDPFFRDHVPFYEFFHGDTGEGLGASHQTGWTGLVAKLLQVFATVDAKAFLERGNNPRPLETVARAGALR